MGAIKVVAYTSVDDAGEFLFGIAKHDDIALRLKFAEYALRNYGTSQHFEIEPVGAYADGLGYDLIANCRKLDARMSVVVCEPTDVTMPGDFTFTEVDCLRPADLFGIHVD